MAKLTERKKRQILKTYRKALQLDPSTEIKGSIQKNLFKRFKKKGAQGVLGLINKKRVVRGIGRRLDPTKVTLRNILKSRPLPEKHAFAGALRQAELPEFDEEGTLTDITEEAQPFFDQDTDEQAREGFGFERDDLTLAEQRRGVDLTNQRRQLAFQESDERSGFNVDIGSRGVSSLSPAVQRLRQRQEERQKFRRDLSELGFARRGEDISRGQSRLDEREDLFRKRRKRAFDTQVGAELEAERNKFLLT